MWLIDVLGGCALIILFFVVVALIMVLISIAYDKCKSKITKKSMTELQVDNVGLEFGKCEQYEHENNAEAKLIQSLYDRTGLVHECNDGRVSNRYFESA